MTYIPGSPLPDIGLSPDMFIQITGQLYGSKTAHFFIEGFRKVPFLKIPVYRAEGKGALTGSLSLCYIVSAPR